MTTTIAQRAAAQQHAILRRPVAPPAPNPVPPVPIDPTRMVYGVDSSNYAAYDFTDEQLAVWANAGVGLVIEQVIDPPAGYPRSRTRQHIGACLSFGMPIAAYSFWWAGAGITYLKRHLNLLDGFENRLVRAWNDIEDTTVARFGGPAGAVLTQPLPAEHLQRIARQAKPERDHDRVHKLTMSLSGLQDDIAAWNEVLDAYPTRQPETGIYSGPWYDRSYVDLSPFAARPWWSSQYDGVADPYQVIVWGGHKRPATIKQHIGTSSLRGYGGIDQNIVSPQETALLAA